MWSTRAWSSWSGSWSGMRRWGCLWIICASKVWWKSLNTSGILRVFLLSLNYFCSSISLVRDKFNDRKCLYWNQLINVLLDLVSSHYSLSLHSPSNVSLAQHNKALNVRLTNPLAKDPDDDTAFDDILKEDETWAIYVNFYMESEIRCSLHYISLYEIRLASTLTSTWSPR